VEAHSTRLEVRAGLLEPSDGRLRASFGSHHAALDERGDAPCRIDPDALESPGVGLCEREPPAPVAPARRPLGDRGPAAETEEIDALRVMAFEPIEFVLAPKYLAALIMVPCLSIASNVCGICAGGLFMFFSTHLAPSL